VRRRSDLREALLELGSQHATGVVVKP